MRVEDFVLPNSIEDWVSLRKEISREFHYQHSQGSMTLVILLMSSHVMSMILFMVSAIKHSRTKDSTTSIIDSEGYIRPRMHTTTPVLVAIYCTIAFLALGSFLHELNVCTASLHMVSISFGLIMA
ncbi:uncharacterized protein MELLADRAFT_74162 [Melampsora larici-populina 98AG31]|uniref:Uncharacterized protein n=1 Tax=Melampsora larici-populina (strain 98AG31 / pathotype 3-4-7) TaxID=747676 RepID=F4RAA7_MELLP|nr:uncharacterized protein MELLADRAFT_74162 [Melampsora larici-populina 98AG31]EGG10446.1 hypothetical protein MELLADRAFT_74162 [Melampsora larici-populina 98AG31]